jgi:hypothetical protein
MRVVDRKTFLAMPPGTLFAKYGGEPPIENCIDVGDLRIKGEPRGSSDWWYMSLSALPDHDDTDGLIDVHEKLLAGEDLPPDFETVTADGLFDQEQLFAVFSAADVDALIDRLHAAQSERTKAESENDGPTGSGNGGNA